ncbi:MAG: hypothetical protein K9N55_05515 [Phycisphaerae bacterium]|nr:hypothetical protein [Phycisphaerae bacterium]
MQEPRHQKECGVRSSTARRVGLRVGVVALLVFVGFRVNHVLNQGQGRCAAWA